MNKKVISRGVVGVYFVHLSLVTGAVRYYITQVKYLGDRLLVYQV